MTKELLQASAEILYAAKDLEEWLKANKETIPPAVVRCVEREIYRLGCIGNIIIIIPKA